MTQHEDAVAAALDSWTPGLALSLMSLGYLRSGQEESWSLPTEADHQVNEILLHGGCAATVNLWRSVLKDRAECSAPELLVILERLRRQPSKSLAEALRRNLRFTQTLANVAFRAADEVHEDAKSAFASAEIDIAIERFRVSLAEFRFAIESGVLSDSTLRIATGKYASGAAMLGRWVRLPKATIDRALSYSSESMDLGNARPETVDYRLELLLQQFDQSGDPRILESARELTLSNRQLAAGSELAQAEVRLRLAALASGSDAEIYLKVASRLLAIYRPRNGVESARCAAVKVLVDSARDDTLALRPQAVGVPMGLISEMSSNPSAVVWSTARQIVEALDYARRIDRSVPAGIVAAQILRSMVNGPRELLVPEDVSKYVEIAAWLATVSNHNRHIAWEAGDAELVAARRSSNRDLARRAKERFEELARLYPRWPLPLIGIARAAEALNIDDSGTPETRPTTWRDAAVLAVSSPTYRRSVLGGRNEVFSVADARGFLSETFVFKPTSHSKAEHEAALLSDLRSEIRRRQLDHRFGTARSLAIVKVSDDEEAQWVHVTQRSGGRLISQLDPGAVEPLLEPIAELLAIFHSVAGTPPDGKSAWGPLKDDLKLWSRTLMEKPAADDFVKELGQLFPADLPLVRKRDGHASNWLVDPVGRIIAIDFESSEYVPLGYDLTQLLEDDALIPASQEGWSARLGVFDSYLASLGVSLKPEQVRRSYSWFATARALRLGTEKAAGKQLRRHARELCGMIAEFGDAEIGVLASGLQRSLAQVESDEAGETSLSHDQRRHSKSMAFMLRHHGPENGLEVDESGFADLEALATLLKLDPGDILATARHPGEPRFEVRGSRVRALYGHSLPVTVHSALQVDAPATLYHGSSWETLETIVSDGLLPMGRQVVHLTNVPSEAIEIGQRKGRPLVVEMTDAVDAQPVAEAIWVTKQVAAEDLALLNPYVDETGLST